MPASFSTLQKLAGSILLWLHLHFLFAVFLQFNQYSTATLHYQLVGAMTWDKTIDGYYVDDDGKWITNDNDDGNPKWVRQGNEMYYFDSNGQDILHSQYGRSTPNSNFPIDISKFGVDTREYWKWRVGNK